MQIPSQALQAELPFAALVPVARVWLIVNAAEGPLHDLVTAPWC